MKNIYILLSLLIFTSINAQIVDIPDANFKAKLLEADISNIIAKNEFGDFVTIDTNEDGEIQESEAELIYYLELSNSNISDLTGVQSFINLEKLFCSSNDMTTVNFDGMQSLETIFIGGNNLTTFISTNLINLKTLNLSNNNLTTLDVSGFSNLVDLNTKINTDLTSLTLDNPNLLFLNCSSNNLNSIDVINVLNLIELDCSGNNLSSLDLSSNLELEKINCKNSNLSQLLIGNNYNLLDLDCSLNSLINLNVSSCYNLQFLRCRVNQLSILEFNTNYLLWLECSTNQLTELNLEDCYNLNHLSLELNLLTNIDLSDALSLDYLAVSNNQFSSLDLSSCPSITGLSASYNNLLTSINFKNGSTFPVNGFLHVLGCNNLEYICTDNIEEAIVYNDYFSSIGANINFNSYCTFTPQGNFNTIKGRVFYDANNNGCDEDDTLFPYIKVNIEHESEQGATFTFDSADYVFYTELGVYDIEPQMLNSSFFNVTPNNFSVEFSNLNNNTVIQDFCIMPVGIYSDISIVLAPLIPARPGFTAQYLLTYTNNGNQNISGEINLEFDDSLVDYITCSLEPSNQSIGFLNWLYSDLRPLESKSIIIDFNVNSPTDTPPVNIDDILLFNASITPIDDDTPGNNSYIFQQVVVGAFDPNNIICLEGGVEPVSNIGDVLHYIVNFENTGNFPAENIVVKLVVDPDEFDINTLSLIESSDEVYANIENDTIEFVFEGINLEYGGHGNILFMVNTLDELVVNSVVTNACDIFFDYNFPVVTNDANTVFQEIIKTNELPIDNTISFSPNPIIDFTSISCDNTINSINIYDSNGRLIIKKIVNLNEIKLNVGTFESGIYFIKVITKEGISFEKLIKK